MGWFRDGNLLSSGDESHERERRRDLYFLHGRIPFENKHHHLSLETSRLSLKRHFLFSKNQSSKETSIS